MIDVDPVNYYENEQIKYCCYYETKMVTSIAATRLHCPFKHTQNPNRKLRLLILKSLRKMSVVLTILLIAFVSVIGATRVQCPFKLASNPKRNCDEKEQIKYCCYETKMVTSIAATRLHCPFKHAQTPRRNCERSADFRAFLEAHPELKNRRPDIAEKITLSLQIGELRAKQGLQGFFAKICSAGRKGATQILLL